MEQGTLSTFLAGREKLMKENETLEIEVFILASMLAFWSAQALAQDTLYPPNGSQIPHPECLNTVPLWLPQGKPYGPEDFSSWLEDITHWRDETRIHIGFRMRNTDVPN